MLNIILDFIREFGDWIRRVANSTEKQPVVLRTMKFGHGTVQLIECAEPGVVDWIEKNDKNPKVGIWKIDHTSSDSYFLIALINIAQLKTDLQQHKKKVESIEPWKRLFGTVARNQIVSQRNIAGTHLIITLWVSKEPTDSRIINGKVHKFVKVECQEVIYADLQGNTLFSVASNSIAKLLVKDIMRRLCNSLWISGATMSWETVVRTVKLHQWLELLSQSYLGEGHILQPKRITEPRTSSPYY